ncbi:MAG: hypothetical protein ACYC0V_08975 [Armatimonadota bacterium]
MPSKFKEGDYVKIITREVSASDMRSRTYYPFFGGLAGIVDKIYDEEICLKVDLDTLPHDILARHNSIQDSIRRKWLDGLSGEARNKLSAEDKKFELAYTMLVQTADLEKAKQGEVERAVSKVAKIEAKPEVKKEAPIKSVTSKDLAAKEEEFLQEREKALKGEE